MEPPMTESKQEFHHRERKLSRFLGPYEKWIIKLQDCFSWDSPTMTISTLIVIHYIFWSIITNGLRLYFIIPSVILLLLLVDTWRNQIWPEIRLPPLYEEDTEDWTPIDPKAMSVPEISWHLAKIWCFITKRLKQLKTLRLESPLLFVIQVSILFTCTGIIGLYISGIMFSYICIIMLFVWSAIKYLKLNELAAVKFSKLKIQIEESIPPCIRQFVLNRNDLNRSSIDDFLPEENPAAMSVLSDALYEDDKDTRASEERLLPLRSSTFDHDLDLDVANSQISDNSANFTMRETLLEQGLPLAFPGHEDLTDDELDKIYPDILPADEVSGAAADNEDMMKFVPTHFNGVPVAAAAENSQAESDELNYNIASVLASGLQAIGTSVVSAATTASAGLEKRYKPNQPTPITEVKADTNSGEYDPDTEEFVFLEPPND